MVFQSKIKSKTDIIVPLTVLVILLLIPQIHWLLASVVTVGIYLFRIGKQPLLQIVDNRLEVLYPYNRFRGSISYKMEELEKVTYVDRKYATPGSYAHSHINIYRKGQKAKSVKIILYPSEIEQLKHLLIENDIDFYYTTKMEVGYAQ